MTELNAILKIADLHAQRIKSALRHIEHLFPINSQILQNFSEEDLAWIDLLINRFGKLQDIIGTKIIDLFLGSQQENVEGLTILDKVNRLEGLGLIENAELWKEMRRTRNHIAHEYPDTPSLMAKYLNQIFELTPKLLIIFANIKARMND
jgi:hypothetical protein